MKIPNASNLGRVEVTPPEDPYTLKWDTIGCTVVIVMKDGTVGNYRNETGALRLTQKLSPEEVPLGYTNKMDDQTLFYIEQIKKFYPNIEKVFIQPL